MRLTPEGGGEQEEEADADLQPEGEETDMHVFQSDAGTG